MEDARPAQAAADSAEQTGAAVVRVDEVCARQAVRKCMPTAQIEQLQKQYAHKKLLEKYGLPRLSLFYM